MKINELRLSTSIYSKNALLDTISAFGKLCSMAVDEEDMYFIVTFTRCIYDVNLTIQEFENYLIGQENL